MRGRVAAVRSATLAGMRALHHLAIQVQDLPRMEAFYRDLFELPVRARWPDGQGGERAVWLGLDGGFLALEKVPPGAERARAGGWNDPRPGYFVLALGIDVGARQAWVSRLGAAGLAIERRTAYSLFFRDPEGNRLAVSHHPQPWTEPGASAYVGANE